MKPDNARQKRNVGLSLVGLFVAALFVALATVPGGPADMKVDATFGTPLYSDTQIIQVTAMASNVQVYYWHNYPGSGSDNQNDTAPIALNTKLTDVYVTCELLVSRVPTSGNVYDHMNVTLGIVAPNNAVTNYYISYTPFLSENFGTIRYYIFSFDDLNYTMSSQGTYHLSIVYKIEAV